LCVGDFNETLFATEHFSETNREEWQMIPLWEVVDDCELIDLGYSGLPYTWDNKQSGATNVKARLDQSFGNQALIQLFPVIKVRHVSIVESDHCMLWTELSQRQAHRPARSFKYENVWQTHADYDHVVADLWRGEVDSGSGVQGLTRTLQGMQEGLQKWGSNTFGNFKKKLADLRRNVERVWRRSLGTGPSQEEKRLVERIKEVLYQEEVWIKQHSRVTWLRAGDRNSGFFHARVAQRKKMNTITTLERQDGSVCENPEDVHGEIHGFYTNLYTSQGAPVMDELLALVPERLDNVARVTLDKEYTEEEIKMALFQMHPSKVLGVDGFTAGFFQRHWDLVREDLVHAVLGVLNGGEWLPHISETTIVLIPKVRHPQSIKQFRPISLCERAFP
jgi:hypothetical protein